MPRAKALRPSSSVCLRSRRCGQWGFSRVRDWASGRWWGHRGSWWQGVVPEGPDSEGSRMWVRSRLEWYLSRGTGRNTFWIEKRRGPRTKSWGNSQHLKIIIERRNQWGKLSRYSQWVGGAQKNMLSRKQGTQCSRIMTSAESNSSDQALPLGLAMWKTLAILAKEMSVKGQIQKIIWHTQYNIQMMRYRIVHLKPI